MIRSLTSIASLIAQSSAAATFAAEGYADDGDGTGLTQQQEEQGIASITHLSIEEVHSRLTAISNLFNVPLEEVTDRFFTDAEQGLLPTKEDEDAAEQEDDDFEGDDD